MGNLSIAVVGGSIAGTAAAILLRRQGHDVTVLERSPNALEERGGGIGMPVPFLRRMHELDLVDQDMTAILPTEMVWATKSAGQPDGRELARIPVRFASLHWAILFQQLLQRAEDVDYRAGVEVHAIRDRSDHAVVCLGGGAELAVDLVIGADGYNSLVRSTVSPEAAPSWAGYPTWRGIAPEELVPAAAERLTGRIQLSGTQGGHSPVYLIPGTRGSVVPGTRRVYWLWYDSGAPGELAERLHREGLAEDSSIAAGQLPGGLRRWLVERAFQQLPSWHADVIARTPEPYLQQIYDVEVDRCARGRVALVGDAATVARPHSAGGTTKALQDAIALSEAMVGPGQAVDKLGRYSTERTVEGNRLVHFGRDLAGQHVTGAPDWSRMEPEDFRMWAQSGPLRDLYFFTDVGSSPESESADG